MATYTVVNWRRLSPSVLDSVCVKGTLTLTHSKKSKTSLEFPEPRRVSEVLAALKERHRGKPASNPKITGWIKLCEHVTINGFKLGPLLGETISRHLNDAASKDWIFLRTQPAPSEASDPFHNPDALEASDSFHNPDEPSTNPCELVFGSDIVSLGFRE